MPNSKKTGAPACWPKVQPRIPGWRKTSPHLTTFQSQLEKHPSSAPFPLQVTMFRERLSGSSGISRMPILVPVSIWTCSNRSCAAESSARGGRPLPPWCLPLLDRSNHPPETAIFGQKANENHSNVFIFFCGISGWSVLWMAFWDLDVAWKVFCFFWGCFGMIIGCFWIFGMLWKNNGACWGDSNEECLRITNVEKQRSTKSQTKTYLQSTTKIQKQGCSKWETNRWIRRMQNRVHKKQIPKMPVCNFSEEANIFFTEKTKLGWLWLEPFFISWHATIQRFPDLSQSRWFHLVLGHKHPMYRRFVCRWCYHMLSLSLVRPYLCTSTLTDKSHRPNRMLFVSKLRLCRRWAGGYIRFEVRRHAVLFKVCL